ncbi:MAG TPA: response regulator [Burkholderiaceae bacterium]|nr:response regulator [Burkholderiaceae bacterium]
MNTETRLLVVDDEPELVEILQEYLTGHGFAVSSAANAAQARARIATQLPDLAVLDIRMPGEDGLSLARWIREQHPQVGIVMLTTAADVVDRVIGLEMGADDYLGKPFELRELLARVKSVLRRRTAPVEPPVPGLAKFGRCTLDLNARKLLDANGKELPLTAMEFDLLRVLADHPNRVLNRDELMELAHRRGWEVFDRSIDLRIMRLRRKIEPDPEKPEVIKTIRGVGYMYVAS